MATDPDGAVLFVRLVPASAFDEVQPQYLRTVGGPRRGIRPLTAGIDNQPVDQDVTPIAGERGSPPFASMMKGPRARPSP